MPERSVFGLLDLVAEAVAGVLQRPARSVLTTIGTVLGVGAFVAVLGLTSTATGQISKRFDALAETTVTVTDTGASADAPADSAAAGAAAAGAAAAGAAASAGAAAEINFPADADRRITALNGAEAAGVYWQVPLRNPVIAGSPGVAAGSRANAGDLPVYAASAGVFGAVESTVSTGRLYDAFHDSRGEPVAVLGAAAARRLNIHQLSGRPAVFIDGAAFTVVGIISDTRRLPELLLGVLLPRTTAERLYPPPDPVSNPARMVIETRLGAAGLIARQAPVALRPDRAGVLRAVAPPDPRSLRDGVSTELSGLFLALAGICLVIGAVSITNTTLVAVMERVGEIGLRRALGARRRHVAVQFLCESTALGALGGLIGTSLGVGVVLAVALHQEWTVVLDPVTVLPAPLVGAITGMLAGAYPAVRAATIEPVEALRR
ncbi:ABC transporter permease [Actinoplanes sp. GCM10030250]|uniref:ABC transporter permease n=1 Tax=Actinoplanes sp. GCM10030250 TaxID=3273376 RepID=UPI00361385A2